MARPVGVEPTASCLEGMMEGEERIRPLLFYALLPFVWYV
jgi:hypothetical protein